MKVRTKARKIFRHLRGPRPTPAILMYHRIAELHHDPWDLAVSPANFQRQLEYLRDHHTVMPLGQLVEGLITRSLPSNAVAITFDDGYRDNLIHAKPLLARYRLPATLFLATGWVGSDVPFWWDELAEWTLLSQHALEHTEVIQGKNYLLRWDEPVTEDLDGTWRASSEPQTDRQKAFIALWKKLRDASQAERTRVMTSLRERFPERCSPLSLPMNQAEVRELIEDGFITIGAHTVHHPALTSLSTDECLQEVVASAEQCRTLTSANVSSFAYPYGDMNARVREIVAGAGFTSACSTRAANLNLDFLDLYDLPRLAVVECDIKQFAATLGA